MGIDGLTNLNLGLMRGMSADDLLNYIKQDSENQAKTVFKKVENSEKIVLNPDSQKKREHPDSQNSEKKEYKNDSQVSESSIEFADGKKYRLTCDSNKEYVEIIDLKSGKIIEKITVEQLMRFFAHIKNPSGILVDQSG